MPGLADELARLRPVVMVTGGGTPPARAAKAATPSIPVLFNIGDDPVMAGLVANLNQAAARGLGRRLVVVGASTETELDGSFSALVESGARALVVQNDPFFDTRRDQLVALAARRGIATIYHIREFPAAGGLMSYGPSLTAAYYQLGIQAGRVLKGANAADLPVVRPIRSFDCLTLRLPLRGGLAQRLHRLWRMRLADRTIRCFS